MMGSWLAVVARGAVLLRSCGWELAVRRDVAQISFRPLLVVLSLGVIGAAPAIGAGVQRSSSAGALSAADLNIDSQMKRDAVRLEQWRSPEARTERTASRTKHQRMSSARALDVAQTAFPAEFTAGLFNGSRPDTGMKVVKRLQGGAAVIEDSAGDKSILQSSLPLETKNSAGDQAPVDLGLVADNGGFHTRNALVDLEVSQRSAEGFSLPGVDVSIAPGGSDKPATESDDRVFFANTHTDTDFVVTPRPDGAEIGWQLRSAESPEQLTLDVDLPVGAVLRRARTDHPIPGDEPRSLEIAKADKVLAYISPPNTYDTDGAPVPSDAKIVGNKVIVSVDHRAGDRHYPLFVDPIVSANDTVGSSWAGWGAASSGGSFGAAVNNPAYNNGGPYLSMPTNTTYPGSGAFIWWQYRAIANTYVYAGTLGGMAHSPSTPYQAYGAGYRTYPWVFSRWFNGLQNGTFTGWEANTDYINESGAYGGNPFGPSWNAAGGVTHAFCLKGSAGRARCDRENESSSDTNGMILGLAAQNNVNGGAFSTGGSPASVTMAWANVYLNDRYAPYMSSPQPADKGWADDTNTRTHRLPVAASDTGLGIDTIALYGGMTDHRLRGATCAGHPQRSPCPTQPAFTPVFLYELDEGVNTLRVQPKDIVDNYGPEQVWTERIDRSPPVIAQPSSGVENALWNARDQSADARRAGLYAANYRLVLDASDSHSGMKNIEVFVDDVSQASRGGVASDGRLDWTLQPDDYADGPHTLKIIARDHLHAPGNETRHEDKLTFNVTVDRRGDIYSAQLTDGDPTSGGEVGSTESTRLGGREARQVDDGTISTRGSEACPHATGESCDVVRRRTLDPDAGQQNDSDGYEVIIGQSTTDAKLEKVANIAQFTPEGTLTASGPLEDSLASWQRPPPAHGGTYDRYDSQTTSTDDSGTPVTLTQATWIDHTTGLPLHQRITAAGRSDSDDLFYTYDVQRRLAAEVSTDFFAVPAPSNPSSSQATTYMGTAPPTVTQRTDTETGSVIEPLRLGDPQLLSVLSLCESGIMRYESDADEPSYVAQAGDDPATVPDDAAVSSALDVDYDLIGSAGLCLPGLGLLDDPALTISAYAANSTTGRAWANAYQKAIAEYLANPTMEGAAKAAIVPVVVGLQSTSAYVVPASDGMLAAMVALPTGVYTIKTRLDIAQLSSILELLEPLQ